MRKKKIVIALGHDALGTTLPEQKIATKKAAKAVVDYINDDYQVVISHSDGGILPHISGVYRNSYVRLFRDEPGIYRLRPSECHPYGTFEPGNLQTCLYNTYTGDRGSL